MNKFKSKVQHNDNDNYNNGVPGAAGGSEKLDSSNPISTHSGTGEKETLKHKCCGNKKKYTLSPPRGDKSEGAKTDKYQKIIKIPTTKKTKKLI